VISAVVPIQLYSSLHFYLLLNSSNRNGAMHNVISSVDCCWFWKEPVMFGGSSEKRRCS